MNADIIIVGAGIIGLMAAQQILQQDPNYRIIQLEQSLIGSGATRFSTAFAPLYGINDSILAMAKESREQYIKLKQQVPQLAMHDIPTLWISKQANLEQLNQRLDQEATCMGIQEHWQESSIIQSGYQPQQDDVILEQNGSAYSLPEPFISTLAMHLKRFKNFALHQSVRLTDIDHSPGQYTVQSSSGQTYQAKRILLASGPTLVPLVDQAPVKIRRMVALHIQQPPPPGAKALYFPEHGAFLLPVKESEHWIFNYTCEQWLGHCPEAPMNLSKDNLDKAKALLHSIAPDFVEHCHGGMVFCDTFTEDRIPLVENAALGNNMVYITGTSGAGFRLAPALAQQALATFDTPL